MPSLENETPKDFEAPSSCHLWGSVFSTVLNDISKSSISGHESNHNLMLKEIRVNKYQNFHGIVLLPKINQQWVSLTAIDTKILGQNGGAEAL